MVSQDGISFFTQTGIAAGLFYPSEEGGLELFLEFLLSFSSSSLMVSASFSTVAVEQLQESGNPQNGDVLKPAG